MAQTETQPCECENVCHDPESRTVSGKRILSPNGNPGHDYGIKFFPRFLRKVKTAYGTFNVCTHCAEDCQAAWEINA